MPFEIGYAAMIAMQSIYMLKLQSQLHACGLSANSTFTF